MGWKWRDLIILNKFKRQKENSKNLTKNELFALENQDVIWWNCGLNKKMLKRVSYF
jgi:hypothetical protein